MPNQRGDVCPPKGVNHFILNKTRRCLGLSMGKRKCPPQQKPAICSSFLAPEAQRKMVGQHKTSRTDLESDSDRTFITEIDTGRHKVNCAANEVATQPAFAPTSVEVEQDTTEITALQVGEDCQQYSEPEIPPRTFHTAPSYTALSSSPTLLHMLKPKALETANHGPILRKRRSMTKAQLALKDGRMTVLPLQPVVYELHMNAGLNQFMFESPGGSVWSVDFSDFIGTSIKTCGDMHIVTLLFSFMEASQFSFPAEELKEVIEWTQALQWLQSRVRVPPLSGEPSRNTSPRYLGTVLENLNYD
eukprot:gb/GEZN01006811.1/.p1 GENE.gb/GEZN01006811.1/~~gb/GEZN01006811.1/.p1  ORF type:complete len:303 (-),score=27.35 gb/GEZN01006811.1/:683-1591(-)